MEEVGVCAEEGQLRWMGHMGARASVLDGSRVGP
jgi:hypothetical protein